jgi:hypothetical protein
MSNRARFSCVVFTAALLFAPSLFAQTETAVVHFLGTTSIQNARQNAAVQGFSAQATPRQNLRPLPRPHFSSAAPLAPFALPNATFQVVGANAGERGFTGITSLDSNQANGGGVAGIGEPPDQGLGGNDTFIVETVNIAFRIFSPSGAPLTDSIGFPAFFGVPPSNGSSSNDVSDPRVFFDPQTKRFFITILEFQIDNATGNFAGSENLLAVSQTSNALGNYFLYEINGCPGTTPLCVADQPLIGVNDDGFYFSNNIFDATGHFVAARILALNKEDLINNTPVFGVAFDLPADFSVEPSLPAPGQGTKAHNGIEYFTESLDNGSGANSLRIFALTNTEFLESFGIPTLLTNDFATEFYINPVPANQKAGNFPLGQHFGDPEELLNTDDDRMLQLYFAGGKLYTTLETALAGPRTGGAWFVIQPSATTTTLSAHIVNQGYIGISNGSVMYPAFAVSGGGNGVIGFSFSGTNFFPSAGYVRFSAGAVEQLVRKAGVGQNPEDGFSGYPEFGGNGVARWGDYSAAFVSPAGHLWFAGEFIPNDILHPRTQFTNWGTFVSRTK